MSQRPSLRGLYVVTPDAIATDPARLQTLCAAALDGGARWLQYRDKVSVPAQKHANARTLRALCRARGCGFIVNDDAALAEAVAADGVHLGQSDGDVAATRARLGPDAIIGVSCGPVLARVIAATAAGASYAAIGRFFASTTKPDAPQAQIADLQAARAATALPLCAIGGIRPQDVAALRAAGADLVAAVAGVFGTGEDTITPEAVRARARAYTLALGDRPPSI